MFFKRLGKSIKKQDWFVVFIEILIVVVGIFIGLQVDDWNSARQDRVREVRYLQRIDSELVSNISEIKGAISIAVRRRGHGRLLLNSLENSQVVADNPMRFVHSIMTAGYTYSPSISRNTYEEMKFSGDLAIIQNEVLRVAISKYYVLVRGLEQWNYMREHIQTSYVDANLGILSNEQNILIDQLESVTLEEAMVTYERFKLKTDFINRIPSAIRWQLTYQKRYQAFVAAAEALRVNIAGELNIRQVKID